MSGFRLEFFYDIFKNLSVCAVIQWTKLILVKLHQSKIFKSYGVFLFSLFAAH